MNTQLCTGACGLHAHVNLLHSDSLDNHHKMNHHRTDHAYMHISSYLYEQTTTVSVMV